MLTYERMMRWSRGHTVVVTAICVLSVGCDGLTDVNAPDVIQPIQLDNPAGARALSNAAIAQLYSQYPGHVYNTGVFSDELFLATAVTSFARLDQRDQAVTFTEYGPILMHQARTQAAMAIAARKAYLPSPASAIGELFAVRGFVELFVGETTCNGAPLSEVVNLIPIYGGPMSSDSMLKRALADFDSAAAYAADSARILNYVQVARGRILTNLGRYTDAAAAVTAVPTAYVHNAELTTAVPGQSNTLWDINQRGDVTVSDGEGVNGLDFQSAGDPRVPTSFVKVGTDGQTQAYQFTAYNSLSSPIPLATGKEARLIEAEAALQAGSPNWLTILTDLRTSSALDFSGVPALADQGSFDANVDLLFRERAFWLFATAHRMGDLRRLVRNYGRTPDQTWPVGPYKSGLSYGNDMVFILTLSEQANPEATVCTDRLP